MRRSVWWSDLSGPESRKREAGRCGACGDLARHPGRPRSTVRLSLWRARHSWPPWPERAPGRSCASPVYRKRSGDRKRRKSSADGLKPVCAVERRRACAQVLSADGIRSHAARAEVSQTSAAADYVLTEASSGAPLPRFVLREKRMVRRNARRARVAKDGRMARASFSPRMSDLSDMRH